MYKTEERTPDWDFDDAEFLGLAPFEGSGSTGLQFGLREVSRWALFSFFWS